MTRRTTESREDIERVLAEDATEAAAELMDLPGLELADCAVDQMVVHRLDPHGITQSPGGEEQLEAST